ncbi:MAG TPA: ABC transporter permease [Bryobacteraceae bacterium]
MTTLLNEMKHAVRLQAKHPGLTIITLIILALGIGATTAVFSVVNTILLEPLPYPKADRILIPWRLAPKNINLGYDEIPWGIDDFHEMARDSRSFEYLAAFRPASFNLVGAGDPVFVEGVRASAQFFHVLGISPAIGRMFTAQEDTPGREHELILSYDLWSERFNRDPAVLGRSVSLDSQSNTVVGVMPKGIAFPRGEELPASFGFSSRPQIWIPLALPANRPPNYPDDLAVMGRLKENRSVANAQTEMDLFRARMENQDPSSRGWYTSRVTSLVRQVTGGTTTPLLLTLAAVGLVLLITCSNVANLLLARSISRVREFALRAALGAGTQRLARQLLIESMLVASTGGIAAIGVAQAAIRLTKLFGPPSIPRLQEASLDIRVLAFALATTIASGVIVALVPALAILKQDLNKSLHEGGRSQVGNSHGSRISNALLTFEVALTLVLVIASALLAQTFLRLRNVSGGFTSEGVLTFGLSLSATRYHDAAVTNLYRQALDGFRAIPGVQSAALVSTIPMDGAPDGVAIDIPGRQNSNHENLFANYTIGSPSYLSTVRTQLLRGRDFHENDTAHSVRVTVINQSMAEKYWPGENPLGRQVAIGSPEGPRFLIVGIAANVKHISLREETGPEMYIPLAQNPFPPAQVMHFVLRGNSEPGLLAASVRSIVRSLDSDLPVLRIAPLKTIVDASLVSERFSMFLLEGFAGMSLLLAACGLYGVTSYSVGQRTREIGLRLALGGEPWSIFRSIIGQSFRLTGLGVIIGLVAAWGAVRLMAGFLYGVKATDPLTFLTVCLLMMVTALLASYLPARRAAKIDPVISLRQD